MQNPEIYPERGLSHFVIECAISYKKESKSIRDYLDEYEKFCKENQINNIRHPFGLDNEINTHIQHYLELMNVAIEYYVNNK